MLEPTDAQCHQHFVRAAREVETADGSKAISQGFDGVAGALKRQIKIYVYD